HLFTHAFFKSLLFLCAGVVIHLVHSNDIKDMGGLRKLMPITHICFLIACLAIAGIPPFSGFFSKEEILLAAYDSNRVVYGVAVFTSALTAFYMFRLYYSIFWSKEVIMTEPSPDEGTLSMKLTLIILGICSLGAGFVPISSWVTSDGVPHPSGIDISFSALPVFSAVGGIVLAAFLYKAQNNRAQKIASGFGGLYKAAYKKFYIDEIYLFVTKKIIFNLVGRPAAWIDKYIVDGFMNLLATITVKISEVIKGLQSGKVQSYTLYFFGGIIALAMLFIYVWR
ncbi:MAG TPA: proton-conducting transporter membrane subunit, partial [Puia sp.]|nr:proton-conducting transporter membrane subunit [Puia sp.]